MKKPWEYFKFYWYLFNEYTRYYVKADMTNWTLEAFYYDASNRTRII